jgi:PPOX class probable F420-dependent enzyme
VTTELHPSARAILESDAVAHLATINRDGSPHVTCAWTGWEDERIVIGTLFDQRKLKNMRSEPRVSLSYETAVVNDWGLKEYLVVYGRAEIVEGGAADLLQRLAHTYLGPDVRFPAMDDPPLGFVTKIAVERVAGVGPWTQAG